MSDEALIDGLNEQQQEIVFAPLSSSFVIAGAGTGKTRVLISRLVYLLEVENFRPDQILAVTFTNKAAQEMKERLCKAMSWSDSKGMWIGTFHGICYRLLRRYSAQALLPANFNLIATEEQEACLKNLYQSQKDQNKDLLTDLKNVELDARRAVSRIMRCKEKGQKPLVSESDADYYLKNFGIEAKKILSDHDRGADFLFEVIFACYERLRTNAGAVDFADLINNTVLLLQHNREVRERLQYKFRYICVDEFQDTNMMQYQLLMLLKNEHNYIFVVGDDDQAIYAWRGANVDNLRQIVNDISDLNIYELSINYRSCQPVLNVSNAVIAHSTNRLTEKFLMSARDYEHNRKREMALLSELKQQLKNAGTEQKKAAALQLIPQDIEALSPGARRELLYDLKLQSLISEEQLLELDRERWQMSSGDTGHRVVFHQSDFCDDGEYVCSLVKKLKAQGYKYEDIAVLYRNNYLSLSVEIGLSGLGIPYQVYGGIKFYERAEILSALAYCKLLLNPGDDLSFSRIINEPRRGIGKAALSKLSEFAAQCGLSLYQTLAHIVNTKDKTGLKTFKKFLPFYELMERFKLSIGRMSLEEVLRKVIEESGLLAFYFEQDKKDNASRTGQSRAENLMQLVANAHLFMLGNLSLEQEDLDYAAAMISPAAPSDVQKTAGVVTTDPVPGTDGADVLPLLKGFAAGSSNQSTDEADHKQKEVVPDKSVTETIAALARKTAGGMAAEERQRLLATTREMVQKAQAGDVQQQRALYLVFAQFLASTSLMASTEITASGNLKDRGVQLMTIHASKGLEFPVVIVIGCEQGILPSWRSDNLEEERRLCYVAFTRAQDYLFASFSQSRQTYNGVMNTGASEFLFDVLRTYKTLGIKKPCRPFVVVKEEKSYVGQNSSD